MRDRIWGELADELERSEHEQRWLEKLSRSTVPTTLVWGLYDVIAPPRVAAHIWSTYLAAKPGANEFWLLPRANHYLQHDQPQVIDQAQLACRLPQLLGRFVIGDERGACGSDLARPLPNEVPVGRGSPRRRVILT